MARRGKLSCGSPHPESSGDAPFVKAEKKIAKVLFKLKFEAMEKLKDDFKNSAGMLLLR